MSLFRKNKEEIVNTVERVITIPDLTPTTAMSKTSTILGIVNRYRSTINKMAYAVVDDERDAIDLEVYLTVAAVDWGYLEDDLDRDAYLRSSDVKYVSTTTKVH